MIPIYKMKIMMMPFFSGVFEREIVPRIENVQVSAKGHLYTTEEPEESLVYGMQCLLKYTSVISLK